MNIGIVGNGLVGSTAAYAIIMRGLGRKIVLVDKDEKRSLAETNDLLHAIPFANPLNVRQGTYEDLAECKLVVIAAGVSQKKGESRLDLLKRNADVFAKVIPAILSVAPESILVVATNPLDIMTYLCWKKSGFPTNKVFGMAGLLDSARFRAFVARELNVSVEDIQALVLGGHGDSMVPLPRYCTVCGIPITELIPKEKIDSIVTRTRKAGGEIVAHLKTGSAYYSPGASVVQMVGAVLKDKKRLLPCAAYLDGQYGLKDVYVGVPAMVGAAGVEKIVEIKLSDEEKKALQASADVVKKNIAELKI